MKAVSYADGKVISSIVPKPVDDGVIVDEAEDAFAIVDDKNSKSIKVVFGPTLT